MDKEQKKKKFGLIEVKDKEVGISELSQLIGYLAVTKVDIGLLITTKGFSTNLLQIVNLYDRIYLLRVPMDNSNESFPIKLFHWDAKLNCIDFVKSISKTIK